MPKTVPVHFAELFTDQAIDISRFEAGVRRRVMGPLHELTTELESKIRRFDIEGVGRDVFKRQRAERLIKSTRLTIASAHKNTRVAMRSELRDLAGFVQTDTKQIFEKVLSVDILRATLTPADLRNISDNSLLLGSHTREWWAKQARTTSDQFASQVRLGVMSGETNDQIVKRIIGSKTGRSIRVQVRGKMKLVPEYTQGVLPTNRRQATALVRTSVQNVSNNTLDQLYQGNDDLVKGRQALVTLDGRTSQVCMARSGGAWDFDGAPLPESTVTSPWPGPPPWHVQCRTITIPVLYSWEELQERMGVQRVKKIGNTTPNSVRASMGGPVPGKFTFDDWLRTKSNAFARRKLGPGRFDLWSEGKLPLNQLIDQAGRPRTLEQLRGLRFEQFVGAPAIQQASLDEWLRRELLDAAALGTEPNTLALLNKFNAQGFKTARQRFYKAAREQRAALKVRGVAVTKAPKPPVVEVPSPKPPTPKATRPTAHESGFGAKLRAKLKKRLDAMPKDIWSETVAERAKLLKEAGETTSSSAREALKRKVVRLEKKLEQSSIARKSFQEDLRVWIHEQLVVDDPMSLVVHGAQELGASTRAKEAQEFLSSIISRRRRGRLDVKAIGARGRAHATISRSTVHMPGGASTGDWVHEIMHIIESLGGPSAGESFGEWSRRYVKFRGTRRSARDAPTWLGRGFGKGEVAYKREATGFVHDYMGKVYRGTVPGGVSSTEWATMAVEELFRSPVRFMQQDPQSFDFLIDLLRGITPKIPKKVLKRVTFKPFNPKGVDTFERFRNPTTKVWTPERVALHDGIIEDIFAGSVKSKKPTFHLMGGGPASGKSTILDKGKSLASKRSVVVDSDRIKRKLPEFQARLKAKDRSAASFVHDESSDISMRALLEGRDRKVDLLLDGTGDGSIAQLRSRIDVMRSKGYRVTADYVDLDVEEAIRRSAARAKKTGRHVPENYIRGVSNRLSKMIPEALEKGLFDEFVLWDNTGKIPVKIITHVKGKPLKVHKKDLWEKFKNRGKTPTAKPLPKWEGLKFLDEQEAWVKSLSADETFAFREWSRSQFRVMRAYERFGSEKEFQKWLVQEFKERGLSGNIAAATKRTKKLAEDLSKAMDRAPKYWGGDVWRGVKRPKGWKPPNVGDTVTMPTTSSFSAKRGKAMEFTGTPEGIRGKGTRFIFKVAKGKGRFIPLEERISFTKGEFEFLARKGQQFKVVKRVRKAISADVDVVEIWMEEVL